MPINVTAEAKRIKKLFHDIPIHTEKREKFEIKKSNFLSIFSIDERKYLLYGFLCILALFFDFWVSKITMKPLAKIPSIKPEVLTLIFNLMDAIIAILASGLLTTGALALAKAKSRWRIILWSLCLIKIVLFIATTTIKLNGKISRLPMLLMVALVILVYTILDFAGGGLYYIVGIIKFWIKEAFIEEPAKLKNKLKAAWIEFDKKCTDYNIDSNNAINYHGINGMRN
jgi:hypothetical protein